MLQATPPPQAAAQALEAFMARLYTDDALRAAFLAAPQAVALQAGLDEATARSLQAVDREGLQLAAASLAVRRGPHGAAPAPKPWARLLRLWPGRRDGQRGA